MGSVNDTLIVLVLGELAHQDRPSQRFVQTFVLHEMENGFYLLNDIFRFLKEDPAAEFGKSSNFLGVQVQSGELKVVNLNGPSSIQEPVSDIKNNTSTQADETISVSEVAPIIIAKEPILEAPKANETTLEAFKTEQPVLVSVAEAPVSGLTENEKVSPLEPTVDSTTPSKTKKNKKKNKSKKTTEGEGEGEKLNADPSSATSVPEVQSDPSKPPTPSPATPTPVSKPKETPKTWAKLTAPTSSTDLSPATEPSRKSASGSPVPRDENSPEAFARQICIRFVKDDTPKSVINEAFSVFGQVRSIDFIQRFVFLEFALPESASKAVAAGHVSINDYTVQVEPRRPRQPGGYSRGFYNRRGGAHNQRRNNFQNSNHTSFSNNNNDNNGWSTPRPANRNIGIRVPNANANQ